jgi:hypothetical protein
MATALHERPTAQKKPSVLQRKHEYCLPGGDKVLPLEYMRREAAIPACYLFFLFRWDARLMRALGEELPYPSVCSIILVL